MSTAKLLRAPKLVLDPQALGAALEGQIIHGNYYCNNFRKIMVINIVLILITIGLVGYIYFQHLTVSNPTYYVTTTDGRLVRLNTITPTRDLLEEFKTKNQSPRRAAAAAPITEQPPTQPQPTEP